MEKSDRKQSRTGNRRQGPASPVIRSTSTGGTQLAHLTHGVRLAGGPDYRDPENRWIKSDHPNIAA